RRTVPGGPECLCRCPGGPEGVKPGPAAGTCPASPATRRSAARSGRLRPPPARAHRRHRRHRADVAGGALGRLAAGPQEQEVLDWSHGLCGSVVGASMACGHVSTTLAQLWWDGEVS
ncbi:hypothetical protein IHE44_0006862, partial [Lamprotornis superbus]